MTKTKSVLVNLVAMVLLVGAVGGCDKPKEDGAGKNGAETEKKQSETASEKNGESKESEASSEDAKKEGEAAKIDGKVLIVLSAADSIELENGESIETGYFMNELAVPARAMHEAGLELVYATPDGKRAKMDEGSDSPDHFEDKAAYMKYRAFLQQEGLIEGTAEFRDLEGILDTNLAEYVAVFVPGGLAPTVDLATHEALGEILIEFHDRMIPTAMLCHGPAALLSTLPNPESFIEKVHAGEPVDAPSDWIYDGYELTVISKKEDESLEEKLGSGLRFYPESVLRAAGADVEVKAREEGFVTEHKELITGQNPMADRAFTKAVMQAIRERVQKR